MACKERLEKINDKANFWGEFIQQHQTITNLFFIGMMVLLTILHHYSIVPTILYYILVNGFLLAVIEIMRYLLKVKK